MREGSPFGKHDTDSSEDSAEAEERQSPRQERVDASEAERRSLAELIMRQHQSRKEAPPPPRGFLGGLKIAKNSLEDDEDEENEEGSPEQMAPAPASEPAESSGSLPQTEETERQQAIDTRVEAGGEDSPDNGAPVEVVPGDMATNTVREDIADHLDQVNSNPRDKVESLPPEASAEPAIEDNAVVAEVVNNDNKPEYAEPNFGKTPTTEIISKTDLSDVDDQELPQNTVVTNTAGGSSSGRPSTGGSGSAGSSSTPGGYPGGGQNAYNAPPPPPSPPGSPPSGPSGPHYNSYGGPSGGSGFGSGNTYTTAAAGANVAPVTPTGNLLRGHEHPHTHPGIIAALLISHALGARRANQLRKDAERTRDDFNKRMQAAEERLTIQDQERRRSMVIAEESQRSGIAAEQDQRYRSTLAQAESVTVAEQQKPTSSIEQGPAVERAAELAEQEHIARREQLVRNRAIAQRESERLERAKEAALGVKPVPPAEHNLGPVEAAYANPNADVGPPLETSRTLFSREGNTLPATERRPEKWEERAIERQHERVGSDQSSAFGAGGQGSQVGSGGQASRTPSPGGLFSQVETIDRAKKKGASGTPSLASQRRSYSKAIAGGFAAGVVVLVLALIAYFIMG